jgi:hypothetical protein
MFVVGAAALGGAAYLWFTFPRGDGKEGHAMSLGVSPGRLLLQGGF